MEDGKNVAIGPANKVTLGGDVVKGPEVKGKQLTSKQPGE